jgi:threonine 3-dehydrogenase
MGATRAVNIRETTLEATMQELGMKEGFDVGLEMSGNGTAIADMLRTMNHGGRVAILGIPPTETSVNWNHVIFKGLTLKGIYGREMFETWYKMTSMLQSGLDITPVLTHTFPVEGFQEGFDMMRSGRSGKITLTW